MIEILIDPHANRLEMRFASLVRPGDLAARRDELAAAMASLQPGFGVMSDLSELEEMDLECAPEIQGMMTHFSEAGVAEVIRVIPDPSRDIGFGIMSAFHYSPRVVIQTFTCREEAESHLGQASNGSLCR